MNSSSFDHQRSIRDRIGFSVKSSTAQFVGFVWLTNSSGQVEATVDAAVARDDAAGVQDALFFGLVLGFVVGAERNGAPLAAQHAARITRVRNVQLVATQDGHDGRAAAIRARLFASIQKRTDVSMPELRMFFFSIPSSSSSLPPPCTAAHGRLRVRCG